MPQLRVGILGFGDIARRVHIRSLSSIRTATVAAIADHDPEALSAVSRLAPGAARFNSIDEMLERSDIDAVIITLPTAAHFDAAKKAIGRSLHVYLEKPMALTLAQAEAMHDGWLTAGTIGMMGFNLRFNPLFVELRHRIAGGQIGRLVAARAVWTAKANLRSGWRTSAEAGGSALLELGSHQLDTCRYLFNTEIAAIRSGTDPDGGVMLHARMESGLPVQLLSAFGSIVEDRWEIYGEMGKLTLDRFGSLYVARTEIEPDGSLKAALRRLGGELRHLRYGLSKARSPGGDPSYRAAIESFIDSAASGVQRSPSFADGLAVQRALEMAMMAGVR